MADHSRVEVRLVTAACLIVAGAGVASAVSPAIETVLNRWVGVPLLVLGGLTVVVLLVRSAWSWLLIEWELRRPLHPDEIPSAAREVEEVRDA